MPALIYSVASALDTGTTFVITYKGKLTADKKLDIAAALLRSDFVKDNLPAENRTIERALATVDIFATMGRYRKCEIEKDQTGSRVTIRTENRVICNRKIDDFTFINM